MAENAEVKKTESEVILPLGALVKEASERGYALFNMPKNAEWRGFRFIVNYDKIQKLDDGTVSVRLKDEVRLRRDGEDKKIPLTELTKAFSEAADEDFKEVTYNVTVPTDAVYGRYSRVSRVLMPFSSGYKGCFSTVPNSCIKESADGEGTVTLELPDWMYLTTTLKDGTKTRILSKIFTEILEKGKESYSDRTHWVTVTAPKDAVIDKYPRQTHIRMPEGEYRGYTYYVPNGMLRAKKDGTFMMMLPETRDVWLKNAAGEKVTVSAKDFKELVDGKEAYPVLSDVGEFQRKIKELKENLPRDMAESPNFVDVRIKRDGEGRVFVSSSMGRVRAIGKAEPELKGYSFDEVAKYGESHRADTMGFVFGGDGFVCISIGNCLDAEGNPKTAAAQKILDAAKGTYAERSGSDLRIFGIMPDIKREHISKDGNMEIFFASDFVPITGDAVMKATELATFPEGSAMREIIETAFDEKRPVAPMTKADIKILEEAKTSERSGEAFTKLFDGENPKGSADFCDESLMMRLSCRTRGDINAMKRIYNASGRENKSPEHMDHLALRAKKNTANFLEAERSREMWQRAGIQRDPEKERASSNYSSSYKS